MELRDYLRIIVKRLWLIALSGVLGSALGLLIVSTTDYFSSYTATATVSVGGDVSTVGQNPSYVLLGEGLLQTYADLVTRRPVLQAVIKDLGLATTPEKLAGRVAAKAVPGTQWLEISVTDQNAETAAAIANSVGRQLSSLTSYRLRNFVTFIEEATPPQQPGQPPMLVVVVSGALGVLLVGGLAFLIEFMRDPVYSAQDLVRRANLPVVLVARPAPGWRYRLAWRTPAWRKVSQAAWWPLMQFCRHRYAELEPLSNPHSMRPRILVTSPISGREKTIVALNLAAAWAKAGSRVVLVDADLRSPLLDKWVRSPRQPGLADLLYGQLEQEDIQDALHQTDLPGLIVLPAGSAERALDGIPSLPILDGILEKLATHADVIVLIGPPVLTTGAGAMLATQVHGVLLAVRVGQARMASVSDARDALAMAQSRLWGVILTEVG